MSTVAVIGAGLMGSGIAQVAAQAGHEVRLRDVGKEQLDRGVRSITESVDRFVAKGQLSREDADAALARITVTTDLEEAAASADIVVEAVFEHIDVKHEVFAVLDEVCRPDAVLATNTSAIPITSDRGGDPAPGVGRRDPLLLAGADDAAWSSWSAGTRPPTRRWPRPGRSPSRSARPAWWSTATSPASSPPG